MKRLAAHDDRFAKPLDGYVGVMGDITDSNEKIGAQMIEALLIRIGEETDRAPNYNDHPGNWNLVENTCKEYKVVKVYIDGFDPFSHPKTSRSLSTFKSIYLEYDKNKDKIIYDYNWKYRKRLTR